MVPTPMSPTGDAAASATVSRAVSPPRPPQVVAPGGEPHGTTREPHPAAPPVHRAAGGTVLTVLTVEYAHDDATVHVTVDPDDAESGARLLCATVTHVRRRRTRRVHTALDVSTPAGGTLLAALRSGVGLDVEHITMRRAGSTAMVTLELLPWVARPTGAPAPHVPGHETGPVRPGEHVVDRPLDRPLDRPADRPRGRRPATPHRPRPAAPARQG